MNCFIFVFIKFYDEFNKNHSKYISQLKNTEIWIKFCKTLLRYRKFLFFEFNCNYIHAWRYIIYFE